MTPDEVAARVGAVGGETRDPETAHYLEDELYADVLRAVADGTIVDPKGCARAALATRDIEFPRWFA